MELKTVVSMVKDVEPETSVSYGRTFVAHGATRIATVPIGYADGYPRAFSGRADMLVHGKRVPVIGRVCMDQLMLDVIQEESASMVIREEDKQFIAKIYAYIFIGVMLDWIKDDMREAPQEIVARLVKLLRGSVTAALRRFRL